jgi:hypothetical protein
MGSRGRSGLERGATVTEKLIASTSPQSGEARPRAFMSSLRSSWTWRPNRSFWCARGFKRERRKSTQARRAANKTTPYPRSELLRKVNVTGHLQRLLPGHLITTLSGSWQALKARTSSSVGQAPCEQQQINYSSERLNCHSPSPGTTCSAPPPHSLPDSAHSPRLRDGRAGLGRYFPRFLGDLLVSVASNNSADAGAGTAFSNTMAFALTSLP